MLGLKKIAVTGGLASGKSSVCQILQVCGAYVVSADEIVHQLLSSDIEIGKQVIDQLGPEIVVENKIDRKKVAQKVFADPKKLETLEKLLHPAVFHEIERRYQKVRKEQTHPLFVAEIPLLFESKNKLPFDLVVAVVADEPLCLERIRKSGHPPEEYRGRMKRQLTPQEKGAKADVVIFNNGTLEELKKQVTNLYKTLTSVAES